MGLNDMQQDHRSFGNHRPVQKMICKRALLPACEPQNTALKTTSDDKQLL